MIQRSPSPEISIVLPCRNEELALNSCLQELKNIIAQENWHAEIIVSDSSDDQSPVIAQSHGVKLIKHDKIGYGRAYLYGFAAAKGSFILLVDPDGSYDFQDLPKILQALKKAADLVIGNRFAGQMSTNAMPWLNRYIGNPFLSWLLRQLHHVDVHDSHSGMRGLRQVVLPQLNLQSVGMEFASEMIIQAQHHKLRIQEIPIHYRPRVGSSKLRPLVDGGRHLWCIIKLWLINRKK